MDCRPEADPPRPPTLLGLTFGFLSMLGPFAIDFYLPALPTIARELRCTPALAQLTLAIFFLALAFGPSLYGPLSDRVGRLPLLYAALVMFLFGSLLCVIAPNIEWLIGARFIQGLGGCGTTVLARAMIRDVSRGHAAARLLARAFLVQGISPLLAPVLGGALLHYMSWRWLFVVIGTLAVIAAGLAASILAETHPSARRLAPSRYSFWRSYEHLLGNRRFMAMSFVAGSSTAGAFAFLTTLPFILAHQYGFESTAIGAIVALVAGSQIIFTQLCPRLLRHWGFEDYLTRVTTAGLALAATFGTAAAVSSTGVAAFVAIVAGLFGTYGLLLTPGAVGALDAAPNEGGAASALLGTLQLLCAAAASMLLSAAPAGALWPAALATCVCTGAAAGAAWLARQPQGSRPG